MARQSVLLAAAVLLSVALWTTSAAKYYGGFEGPSLFAPAGADKDSAVIGVHVELGMLTEAAKGNTDAIGAAAKALASDLFSAGAPCYMDGMSIVADPATFAFPDEEKGRFDTMCVDAALCAVSVVAGVPRGGIRKCAALPAPASLPPL